MHDIKIHDVSFSYAGSDKLVLNLTCSNAVYYVRVYYIS